MSQQRPWPIEVIKTLDLTGYRVRVIFRGAEADIVSLPSLAIPPSLLAETVCTHPGLSLSLFLLTAFPVTSRTPLEQAQAETAFATFRLGLNENLSDYTFTVETQKNLFIPGNDGASSLTAASGNGARTAM
jgi:hypothetical protein